MKQKLLLKSMLLLFALIAGSSSVWADTYEQLTSIANIDESAEYVLGIDGTGFHYSGTSSWGLCALPSAQTPIKYTLKKSAKGDSFTAETTISSTKYYLQVPTSNTFSMATATGTNTDLIIGTTQVSAPNYAVANKSTTTRHLRINGSSGLRSYAGTTGSMAFFYKVVGKTNPTITFNNGSVRVGKTLDLSTLFSSNSTGAVTYSITAGNSYASLDGSNLTGVAEGSVTVKASQAATDAYNAGEASATITVNAALVLSSIAITTAPTKITYKEGQIFDPTGMVVTATYSDTSTDDVTAYCSYTPSGALSASDTKVTISYTENAVTRTADQAITVNTQSTTITINPDYEWLGVSNGGNIAAANLPKAIDNDGLTVTFGSDGSTKPRGDEGYIRIYTDNAMTFTAPASHFIKSIVFTQASVSKTKWDNSFDADEGTWNNSTKTWSCGDDNVEEVALTCDGTKFISKIVVTLVPYVVINPAIEYTTLTSAKNLDFTSVNSDLKAYIATTISDNKVQMTQVNKVSANTGLVLKATTPGSAVGVPVFDGTGADDVSANKMAGSATATTAIAANGGYILKDGVFQPALAGTLPAGKAYLNIAVPAGAPILNLGFDDATGIESIAKSQELTANGQYYNLAGQRVAQPTKGLYIVNGKKYIVK